MWGHLSHSTHVEIRGKAYRHVSGHEKLNPSLQTLKLQIPGPSRSGNTGGKAREPALSSLERDTSPKM